MNAQTQHTLVLIKPDGLQRGLVGTIVSRLETRGLKIVAMKMLQMDQKMAEQHYNIHRERPFFQGLVSFITSSPIIAIVLEGPDAVELIRNTIGVTNPIQAPLGTIRGDFALTIGRNLVHGSDSMKTAASEIKLFFQSAEILDYPRDVDPWIIES